jgi:formylglycine-generating enzyme required for sulfatase activity
MLIQRAGTGTLPPPGFTPPPWMLLAMQWDAAPLPDAALPVLGPTTVVLGHPDSEGDDYGTLAQYVNEHVFGWDNESPTRAVAVGAFRAEWRPVSNHEYLLFWDAGGRKTEMPASWLESGGEITVILHLPVSWWRGVDTGIDAGADIIRACPDDDCKALAGTRCL